MHGTSSTITRPFQDEWADCERELHATAMPDVQRYESDLRALRAEADRLQDLRTLDQLIDAWPSASETGSDRRLKLVRGAAFALRARDIQAAVDARLVEERIASARAAGETWVVLQETGDPNPEAAAPFSTAAMHLASGLATLSMAQHATMTNNLVYSLTIIRLENKSGVMIDATPGLEDWLETRDRAALDGAIDGWRRRIETGDVQV
ncbi:hypothetical protein PX554_18175 [Sphingomonas sp. H39-1-10]|uniref:hypothetical protein n=1 Tax=Sphingomonas pollutisoli TaxID=3030829 RepID=UPI0023BA23E1|nr:hypothetical protein [Sphingomonas pollutisoli]MDF0490065.1 hypothetical protein [Sphingomonas pollutisoli]